MASVSSEASDFTEIVNPDDIFIAVIGLTGSGKSSLIASCTGQKVVVGHGLLSCTTSVSMYSFDHCNSSGRKFRVHLIDTPGFDDSKRTDVQVLQEIVFWLAQADDREFRLNGIVFLQSIAAPRFEGAPKRCFEIFKALVGEKNFKCVYLAATFWDVACRGGKSDFDNASRRHDQMEDDIWRPLIDTGAQMRLPPDEEDDVRHGERYAWVHEMLEYFTKLSAKHTLQIQMELRNQHTTLANTTAGRLAEALWSQDSAHRTQVPQLRKTKGELLKEWSAFVNEDISKLKQELNGLNHQISQSESPPSYYNSENRKYSEDLRRRKEEVERAQLLKLTSYGYRVQVASAGIGFGSLVFGGISAAAALGACSLM